MYENNDYDNEKFTHSMFGDYTFRDNREFGTFKSDNNLPYDCFWDGTGDVKHFFADQLGALILNDVFAVMPNGIMIKYDLFVDGDFEEWTHSMYEQAYPN
ncbi:MAG: hypothetical protein PF574_00960 [Candidatus Delongbacteria bacterium]|jgi:hypothetical protein|nr:hypothetical protein [Candidatus Delongbacteria bacterium]